MIQVQHPLWGFLFDLPPEWSSDIQGDQVTITPASRADEAVEGSPSSLQVRAEWNGTLQPIGPIWTRHTAKLASIFGARDVGSAPWSMGGAVGIEAEIKLPKKTGTRLWAGVLTRDFIVLQLAVTHALEKKKTLDPIFTGLVSSLRFVDRTADLETNRQNIPLPPGASPSDPITIIQDIAEPAEWQAYSGGGSIGALQAFYRRELPNYGWTVHEFLPFPGSSLGFARFKMENDSHNITLGIMPVGEPVTNDSPAAVVIKTI